MTLCINNLYLSKRHHLTTKHVYMLAKLTATQFRLIEDFLLKKIHHQKKYIFIKISEDEANDIRKYVEEKLLEIGFDKNLEPNENGKTLEQLLDIFYIE